MSELAVAICVSIAVTPVTADMAVEVVEVVVVVEVVGKKPVFSHT